MNSVNDILVKLDLPDFNFTMERGDDKGDFVQAFCPELGFKLVKNKILNTKCFEENIKDIGPDGIILTLKGVERGFNYFYDVKIVSGGAFGTRISIGTRRVDYYTDAGEYIPCVNFEMMNVFISKFKAVVD